jgi:hypothetical protein
MNFVKQGEKFKYAFSIRSIKVYPNKLSNVRTEQRKLCCIIEKWIILNFPGGDFAFQRNYEWSPPAIYVSYFTGNPLAVLSDIR